jgi:hypothetical protein
MKKLSFFAALLLTNLAWSQTDTTMDAIATDRPDITESAFITPVGWFQYEGGYQFSNSVDNLNTTTNRHQVEEVLRFGVTERFEVRAVINANTESYKSPTIFIMPEGPSGIEPITVGFKYNLAKESDRMPQTTWLSHLSFPQVAFGDYRAVTQVNTVFHEQRLMMEKGITDRFGLATNIGVAGTLSGSNGIINEGMFSFAAGYDLGNNWGMYAEYFMNWQLIAGQFFYTPYVDGGITKLLSNDLQLDIYAGYDLSEALGTRLPSTGWFIGTGVSYRLPLAHYLR